MIKLDVELCDGGFWVFYGKKYMSYGVVMVVVCLVNMVLNDVFIEFFVLNFWEEYGVYFLYLVVVGCDGIVE